MKSKTKKPKKGKRHVFFAGGGTGGHLYPAIAVAEQLKKIDPETEIAFLCSKRPIDSNILSKTSFKFICLPARGLSFRPDKLIMFVIGLLISIIRSFIILISLPRTIVFSNGGFVSAPVVIAAHWLRKTIIMLNVDSIPGLANQLLANHAKEIYLQFKDSARFFVNLDAEEFITGCPIREGFRHPNGGAVLDSLGLDRDKKTILVTGASSGSVSINKTVCALLPKLDGFIASWQIIHLTGKVNYQQVLKSYENASIDYRILDYYDDMPSLYDAADIIIGRAGAVSVAEYAATDAAVICIPYPYHKDRHQYLNAEKIVEVEGAVIVDDQKNCNKTSVELYQHLHDLMVDDERRLKMAVASRAVANLDAAKTIAERIISIS